MKTFWDYVISMWLNNVQNLYFANVWVAIELWIELNCEKWTYLGCIVRSFHSMFLIFLFELIYLIDQAFHMTWFVSVSTWHDISDQNAFVHVLAIAISSKSITILCTQKYDLLTFQITLFILFHLNIYIYKKL